MVVVVPTIAIVAVAVMTVAIMVVAIPAMVIGGTLVSAVVALTVPGHHFDWPATSSALNIDTSQAGRAGLSRRCKEGKRNGTEPCRKKRLHMHQASPLVLACSPLLRSVRRYRSYGG